MPQQHSLLRPNMRKTNGMPIQGVTMNSQLRTFHPAHCKYWCTGLGYHGCVPDAIQCLKSVRVSVGLVMESAKAVVTHA